MPSRAHTGTELTGPFGTATEVVVTEHGRPDMQATIATWFLRCPGQSPAWDRYVLSIIHLRPIPGVPPADVRGPHATHEVMLLALNPEHDPRADDPETWQWLQPINVMEQVQLPDDDAARHLLEDAARAVVHGILWAEPPLSGQVEPWRTALIKTAAHARGEEHAP